tara:strand:- start:1952 stop:2215 length:264 start_codon:yes stop_codon:yes gene_type:complete
MAYLKGQVVKGNSSVEGSKILKGSLEINQRGSGDILLIKNDSYDILKVNESGILQFHIFEDEYNPPATLGGIFFHSSSMYIGLEEKL